MRIINLTLGYGFDKNNKPIEHADTLLQGVRKELATTFGGFTETQGLGGWLNPEGIEVIEAVKVYSIATDKTQEEIAVCAAKCRDLLMQHSVFLSDNNQPRFV